MANNWVRPFLGLGVAASFMACSKSSSKSQAAAGGITDPVITAADYQRCATASNIATSLTAHLTKTITTSSLTVYATATLSVKVSSDTGHILFDIESSDVTAVPEYARGSVIDQLNATTGTIDLIKATDAEITASGYLNASAEIDCHILFVKKQVSKKDNGTQKIVTYDPPLPFGILPQADDTVVAAYFTTQSQFSNITATVAEVYGGSIAQGTEATGSVTVSGSSLDYTFTNNFATSTEYDTAALSKSDRFKVVSAVYSEVDMNYEILFPGSTTPDTLNVQFR